MDTESIFIGAILIAVCIIPFVIMHYKSTQKENKHLQSLSEIAKLHNCKISRHEFCGNVVIGLDENSNFIFFLKQNKEGNNFQYIDLSEIKACQIVKKTLTIKNNNENVSLTTKVELCFKPISKSKIETIFEIYNNEINGPLKGEINFADNWSKLIDNQLKNKK